MGERLHAIPDAKRNAENRMNEGRCNVAVSYVEGSRRPVACDKPAVVSETWTDQGCPDDPEDGPYVLQLRYCVGHAHLAEAAR